MNPVWSRYEKFFNNNEGDEEVRPGQDKNVHVNPGKIEVGIDIVTNDAFNISDFGALNAIGFGTTQGGRYYAVQVPAAQISAINPGEDILAHSVLFETFIIDASTVPVFAEAMLTTGTINPDTSASIDLAHPLDTSAGQRGFVRRSGWRLTPLFLKNPHELGRRIRLGIAEVEIENPFLVL